MIRLHLLSPFACRDEDGEELSAVLRSPARLAVLTYLTLAHPLGYHRRDTLLGLLWPESSQKSARTALRVTLHRLRSELDDALVSRGKEEVGVDRERLWCDALAFEEALELGRTEEGLELYRQDLLEGFHSSGAPGFERWLESERRRLRGLAADAAWRLAEERRENPAEAAGLARRAFAFTPNDEAAFRRLIRSLDATGNRLGALREYERFAARIADDFGSEPSPETRALIEAIGERAEAWEDSAAADGALSKANSRPAPGGSAPSSPGGRKASAWTRRAALSASVSLAILLALGSAWMFNQRGGAGPRIGNALRLTAEKGLEIDPAISPDGERIAYAAGRPGEMKLYVQDRGGSNRLHLTARLTGNHRSPRWSADGSEIGFETLRKDTVIAHITQMDGGEAVELFRTQTSEGMTALSLTWSPDGEDLAYKWGHRLYVRPRVVGEERLLVVGNEPGTLSWSPTGKWIAYAEGNPGFVGSELIGNVGPSSLWLVSPSGGQPVRVTGDQHMNTSPIWDPDGRHLFFVSNRGGTRDIYRVAISESGAPEGEPVRITTGLDPHTISLSSDGDRLAYTVLSFSANIWSIAIPRGDEIASISAAVPLTTGQQVIESLDVSPDGRFLAFDSNRRGNQDIYFMPIEGGGPVQLTDHPADDFGPSWSPDGTQIAFYSFRDGDRDLYIVDAKGGDPVQVTDYAGHEAFPDWSPDGSQLVFQVNPTGAEDHPVLTMLSRDASGRGWSKRRQLISEYSVDARWSPDGKWVAFAGERSLRIVPAVGGEARVLVEFQKEHTFPEWAPDGQTIYYRRVRASDQGFWAISPNGGSPRLIVRDDDPTKHAVQGMMATDGERLYFTVTTAESDIWIAELER